MRALLLALALVTSACGDDDDDEPIGDPDAGLDSGTLADSGHDSGSDTGVDAAPDAEVDAGPPRDPLVGMGKVELVAEGYQFLEGPQWRDDLDVLVFSDIDGDTIYSLSPPSSIDVFRRPSGRSNGLAQGTDGLLLAAEHANRRISQTLEDGSVVTMVERYGGARLNSPNDIVVRSDGTIYFTDPPYGLADQGSRELDFNGVFRLDPRGELTTIWEGDPDDSGPNGVALAPDERTLYVSDSSQALVRAFDVQADGSAGDERIFVETSPVPDGMAMDRAGNLFVTTSAGIEVFAPGGAKWGTIAIPREPANCAFAGPAATTLYVTAVEGLYRIDLAIAGIP